MFEKSIDLDPVYADPYGTLSWIYLLSYIYQWDKDGSAIDRAADFINKSIALDDSDGDLYAVRAWIVADKGTRSDAIADGKRAVSLAPNSAFCLEHAGRDRNQPRRREPGGSTCGGPEGHTTQSP
jgi:hypothetical protein